MTAPSEMPKPRDVLLFAHGTGWNRMITFLTRSRFYHVAIIYAGDFHVVEARPQGVVLRDLRGPEGTHFCAVLSNPGGEGQKALSWVESQIGDKYDRWDILVIVLKHIFTHLHLKLPAAGSVFMRRICRPWVRASRDEFVSRP